DRVDLPPNWRCIPDSINHCWRELECYEVDEAHGGHLVQRALTSCDASRLVVGWATQERRLDAAATSWSLGTSTLRTAKRRPIAEAPLDTESASRCCYLPSKAGERLVLKALRPSLASRLSNSSFWSWRSRARPYSNGISPPD